MKQTSKKAANDAVALSDLFTVEGLAKAYPDLLTVPTLRWQLRHRASNGLAPCCVPVGRRVLISKSRYECWLASRAGAA